MRTRLMALAAALLALLVVTPATAGELFRAGVVSCEAKSRSVTALSLDRCRGGSNEAKREMFGSCDGSFVANRKRIPFVVSAYIRETSAPLPDNDKPLAFDYRGMRCQVKTWRLRSVHNCSYFDSGNGMACDVCITLFGKHCYSARMNVTARR